MVVKIVPNDKGNPPGKLADAELHFAGGPLDGLKLIRIRDLGASRRQGPQRHVSGSAVLRQRRAPQLRAPATGGRLDRAGSPADLVLQAYASSRPRRPSRPDGGPGVEAGLSLAGAGGPQGPPLLDSLCDDRLAAQEPRASPGRTGARACRRQFGTRAAGHRGGPGRCDPRNGCGPGFLPVFEEMYGDRPAGGGRRSPVQPLRIEQVVPHGRASA